ncbi:hypothetical protein E2C01_059910 [Portunus trituberculatus]|uniref:Uncharacterized protein n=1 Tax=Portunus trituberculatus TaxID=210409 RepID=A0A5B7HAK8_PORTR|nr:hypothetical protein [Portunus trituberculatus]
METWRQDTMNSTRTLYNTTSFGNKLEQSQTNTPLLTIPLCFWPPLWKDFNSRSLCFSSCQHKGSLEHCLLQDRCAADSNSSDLCDTPVQLPACKAATSTEVMVNMEVGLPPTADVAMPTEALPPLPAPNKRICPTSPVKDATGDKTSRIEQDFQPHPDQYVKVSFLWC